ncbi:MAG: ABC transporter ATP-binding protein/permease, partial [Acetatifactor sp.]|nr:ABC transporter ATP-binding protein/permease [Acetatifactor sp.]
MKNNYSVKMFTDISFGGKMLPVLGSMIQIALSLVTLWLPKIILDCVTARVSLRVLYAEIGLAGGLWLLLTIADQVVRNVILAYAQTRLYTRLIPAWEKKTMELDYELFSSPRGKVLMEKARQAVCSPNWGMVTMLPRLTELFTAAGGLLAYGIVLGGLHPLAVLALLLLSGLELWQGIRTERKKQGLKQERAEVGRRLNYVAYGTRGLGEGKDIRIYHMAGWLREMARLALGQKRRLEQITAGYERRKLLFAGALILLRDGCAYGYILYSFFHRDMTVGDFAMYFTAVTGLGGWLGRLTESISQLQESRNFARDYWEYMELGDESDGLQKGVSSGLRDASELPQPVGFQFRDVSYAYTETGEDGQTKMHQVLEHLNLDIAPGEKLAVVGANGAGKTTFVKLLCGLLHPQQGEILVGGVSSQLLEPEEYYHLFSAVFQNSGVLPVSIADNIALNITGDMDAERLQSCIRAAGLEEKISSLPQGEDTCLNKRVAEQGTELSGGQLQRLLLARALYK